MYRALKNSALLLGLALTAGPGQAADSGTQAVDDMRIWAFKLGFVQGCVRRGLQRGQARTTAQESCRCMVDVLQDRLSRDELLEVIRLAEDGTPLAQIAPLKRSLEAISTCKE